MSAEEVLAKLDGVTQKPDGSWSAKCPAHADRMASLSVTKATDGKVLIHCHAGCKPEAVCESGGISRRALAGGRSKGAKAPKVHRLAEEPPVAARTSAESPEAGARRLAAAQLLGGCTLHLHPYVDAAGRPIFWRIRCKHPSTGEKWMRPMHFNGLQHVLGEPPAPEAGKPLYLLPALAQATGPVFVVEGESCADALATLGIAATTSGGADSAGAADWSPLAGRSIVVWPDNDDPGFKYAADVSEKLRALGCTVELIDVGQLGLAPKDDAVDWLDATDGAAATDVLALARVAAPKTLVDKLADSLVPLADDIWKAADEPHPHAFQDGHVGIFPVGEVTVIGSPGRTGKTTAIVAISSSYIGGEPLAGLQPKSAGPVVVLSAEDSPTQFARKLKAASAFMPAKQWARVQQGFIVPDFDSPLLAPLRQLVSIEHGQPAVAPEVDTIVQALYQLQAERGIGLVIIETASTWNAANEDNPSFRALIAAAKLIARTLNVAVVLTHHVNQSSGINLSKLDLSVADLRGGTTFVDNSRQVALLVNLNSADNPFPDDDARTVLRHMVAPGVADKISALVFLNSSQGEDVPPVFFQWKPTPHGPACIAVTPPPDLRGRKWYALREMVKAQRPARAESKKAAKVEGVVAVVRSMHKLGQHPTARAVSVQAGQHQTWATDAPKEAVDAGHLVCSKEKVPRVKEKVDVYRPAALVDAPNESPDE